MKTSKIGFRSLQENIDTTTSGEKLIFHLFGALAEFERNLIRERTGGASEPIRPGDVIWFEPGEKQWHSATATTAMTHIAVREWFDGKPVDWLKQVSSTIYQT